MSLQVVALALEAVDPAGLASFWGGLLRRDAVREAHGSFLIPAEGTQLGLRFVVAGAAAESGPRRLHLHLSSTSWDHQRRTVERALSLGGRHVDVGQLPEDRHVVLGDPEANELCVIEPDNDYLAGCGFFAEVSHVGSREAGLFWRDALGWPLVWDRGGETAIQLPEGGTKLSWDGPPVPAKEGRNPHHLDLVAADLASESDRLISLGATWLAERDGRSELADPDGNEFLLAPG
jgi:hypothetical protein